MANRIKKEEEIQNLEYTDKEKSFSDEIKSILNNYLRAFIR